MFDAKHIRPSLVAAFRVHIIVGLNVMMMMFRLLLKSEMHLQVSYSWESFAEPSFTYASTIRSTYLELVASDRQLRVLSRTPHKMSRHRKVQQGGYHRA